MKIFYTEQDIIDMHVAGTTELQINDDVVLTDLAREKAQALGIHLKPVTQRNSQPATAIGPTSSLPVKMTPSALSVDGTSLTEAELVAHIKTRVMAKLGTGEYDALLDQIIPQVLARLQQQY